VIESKPLLEIRELRVWFPSQRGLLMPFWGGIGSGSELSNSFRFVPLSYSQTSASALPNRDQRLSGGAEFETACGR
jgi:hypothetical protein